MTMSNVWTRKFSFPFDCKSLYSIHFLLFTMRSCRGASLSRTFIMPLFAPLEFCLLMQCFLTRCIWFFLPNRMRDTLVLTMRMFQSKVLFLISESSFKHLKLVHHVYVFIPFPNRIYSICDCTLSCYQTESNTSTIDLWT